MKDKIKKLIMVVLILVIASTTANAKTFMFNDKASRIQRWMAVKGYSGTVYDAMMGYFSSLSTISEGTLYDHVANVMVNLGYTGTMKDMLNAFFIATTSIDSPKDAERAFWANDSYSFGASSGGFVFVDGNNFIFVDGNNFIFVT